MFHEIQLSAPPFLTASNAGMPITSHPGKALLICSIACSSSSKPNCGTKTKLPTCR